MRRQEDRLPEANLPERKKLPANGQFCGQRMRENEGAYMNSVAASAAHEVDTDSATRARTEDAVVIRGQLPTGTDVRRTPCCTYLSLPDAGRRAMGRRRMSRDNVARKRTAASGSHNALTVRTSSQAEPRCLRPCCCSSRRPKRGCYIIIMVSASDVECNKVHTSRVLTILLAEG